MKLMTQFIKPYRKLLIFTILLIFLDVIGALYIPTLVAEMLNQGTSGSTMNNLYMTGIQIVIASLVSGVGAILGGYTCAVLSSKVCKDIRDALYQKSLKLSVYDFKQFGTASITTRTISDVTNIQTAFISVIQMVLPVPAIFIIAIILTFHLDTMAGTILLIVLAIVILVAICIMKMTSPLFKKLQKLLDRMSTVILENLTCVRVIRAFNKQQDEQNRLDRSFEDYAGTSIKTNQMFANLDGLSFFSINIFIIIIYWISGGRISNGYFQIGDITALIEYAMLALFYLMMAQMIILTLPRALECCNRVQAVLEHTPEIVDLVTTDTQDEASEDVLTFDHVSFRYADAQEDTLHDLDFSCKRGQTTAIIGGTGSGKSTVASLILRFHNVTQGSLRLNGKDIRDMTQHHLREHISYVQQQAWLFSGSIADNLRYGNADASDEELQHALEVAQASDFVSSLPEGLNSFVAQGGTNFSGGQKQRLSIARALVKKPELYIFDDSFSALDFKTDAALRKALAKETQDVAVLIIAQRVSTIRHADRIVVLNEGKIAGKGTHDELMESCSVYREIVNSQTKKEDEYEQ
ncbi:ABC transporter ATP-binding protein [Traorella massiliensis]|uniref:ABC transporter ATP-binding protein n=2 Tax=Traorella massiliensis TaxID=1903263 RepID=UPI0008F8B8B6|nr:ABC transporter ATP-binding protein [Traorella massiliensis]